MNISVVIPTYNRAHLIKASIQSVLDQTLSPYEVIIVDDHSTDHTQELVESYLDPRVKYVKNQRAKGANGARNTGILLAKGEIIAFQDSDDIWKITKLEKQINFMNNHPGCDMCFCSLSLNNGERIIPKRQLSKDEMREKLLRGNFISTQTIVIKKETASSTLFDEDLMRFQDWDFCLRVANKHEIGHVNEALVDVEHQSDSISKKVNGSEALNQLFQKHPELENYDINIKALYQKELFNKKYNEKKWLKTVNHYCRYIFLKIAERLFFRNEKI